MRAVVLMLVCLGSAYAEAKLPQPERLSAFEHPGWKAWLDKYTGSTPWLAEKKSSPAHFLTDEKYLDIVLAGNSKLEFEKPLYAGKVDTKSYDLFRSVEARRFEVFDQIDYALLDLDSSREQNLKQEERNRSMRDSMIKLITSRADDELLLIYTGAAHANDLFFRIFLTPDISQKDPKNKLRDEVIYVGIPVTEATAFFTEDYEDFITASRGVKQETETVQEHSLQMAIGFLARLYYYNNLKHGLVSKDAIVKEHPVKFGTLIFLDTHYLRVEEPFKSMPGPSALKDLGINKVRVAMEGWKADKTYESEDMKSFYTIQAGKRYSPEDLAYFKKFRPKAYEIYQKNFITNLSIQTFHSKLKTYESAGVEVVYTGLEDFDRMSK